MPHEGGEISKLVKHVLLVLVLEKERMLWQEKVGRRVDFEKRKIKASPQILAHLAAERPKEAQQDRAQFPGRLNWRTDADSGGFPRLGNRPVKPIQPTFVFPLFLLPCLSFVV